MAYAIMNKRNGKFLYGTDFRRSPFRQMTSEDIAIIFRTREQAELAMQFRRCGKDYVVVPVRIEELQE